MNAPLSKDWMTSGEGHPKRWAILGVLVTSLLVVVLDNTILNIALPTIQKDLSASSGELLWAIDSYILAFAALLFTWGVLGDKYGRKRILIIGLVIFALASAACSFAPNVGTLIAFRTVMGVGGAAVLPTTLAIITVVFPPHERGKAIGAWAASVGAAVALGPVLGGLLLQNPQWSSWLTHNDWGSVFLINVPVVIIGVIGILRTVPETRNPHAQKLDIPGLVISAVGLGLVIYGIIHASSERNWLAMGVVIPVVVGLLVLALFVWLESRSDHKSFDVTLFANRGYAVSLTAASLSFFALSGITFTLPFYLQIIRGFSTLTAGLAFIPFAVGQIIAAPRSAGMVVKFGYKAVMATGMLIVGAALACLATINAETPIVLILVVFFLFGFGMGNVIAPASTVMQNVLPLARVGAGSAVQNTVRQVGGALGVAVIGTILANQYASRVETTLNLLPSGIPADIKDEASQSIVMTAGLIAKIEPTAPALAEQIREGAYNAFLSSSHVTSWISAGVIVAAAIIVITLLPHISPPQKGDRAVGAKPVDAADALVLNEEASYAQEAAQEYAAGEHADPAKPQQD